MLRDVFQRTNIKLFLVVEQILKFTEDAAFSDPVRVQFRLAMAHRVPVVERRSLW